MLNPLPGILSILSLKHRFKTLLSPQYLPLHLFIIPVSVVLCWSFSRWLFSTRTHQRQIGCNLIVQTFDWFARRRYWSSIPSGADCVSVRGKSSAPTSTHPPNRSDATRNHWNNYTENYLHLCASHPLVGICGYKVATEWRTITIDTLWWHVLSLQDARE